MTCQVCACSSKRYSNCNHCILCKVVPCMQQLRRALCCRCCHAQVTIEPHIRAAATISHSIAQMTCRRVHADVTIPHHESSKDMPNVCMQFLHSPWTHEYALSPRKLDAPCFLKVQSAAYLPCMATAMQTSPNVLLACANEGGFVLCTICSIQTMHGHSSRVQGKLWAFYSLQHIRHARPQQNKHHQLVCSHVQAKKPCALYNLQHAYHAWLQQRKHCQLVCSHVQGNALYDLQHAYNAWLQQCKHHQLGCSYVHVSNVTWPDMGIQQATDCLCLFVGACAKRSCHQLGKVSVHQARH